jgi:putative phage-type endonuclease
MSALRKPMVISSRQTIRPLEDKAGWLALRLRGIGASEAAAVMGESPHESARGVWLRKVGMGEPVEMSERIRWGLRLEPAIIDEFQERTGRRVVDRQVFLHELDPPEGPPLLATLDGILEDGIPLEVKCTDAWNTKAIGNEDDELPPHFVLQAQQQAYLAGAPRVQFAILIGGNRLVLRTVERDDEMISYMLERMAEFWGYVERREPPPMGATPHKRDARLMHLLYPGSEGSIELDEQAAMWKAEMIELGEAIKDASERKMCLKLFLLDKLGNHAVGHFPDGSEVTRKVVHVPERLNQYVPPTSYPGMWFRKGNARAV